MDTKQKYTFEMRSSIDIEDHAVYISGNFNNWTVREDVFKMQRVGDDHFKLEIDLEPSMSFEYKYNLGTWDYVELDEQGNSSMNRLFPADEKVVCDFVPKWRWAGRNYDQKKLPIIEVISDDFNIPQLIKTRRIAVLLPHDYYTKDKRYPVLYLQDGQNLYDDYAPYGTWGLDKRLAIMQEQDQGDIIVVAIDHGAKERIAEYTPSFKTRLGVGDGEQYVDFLAETLKPFIDKRFRTLADRDNTAIGGSSMGGLITIYAGLLYPEVYSKLMVFSPSLWVAPDIHHKIQPGREKVKMYLYAGNKETSKMVANMKRFKDEFLFRSAHPKNVKIKESYDPEGHHNEQRWGQEFPFAVEWLFK